MPKLLYENLTYKIRGAIFNVHSALGPIHKESVYQRALAYELQEQKIPFRQEVPLRVKYKDKGVGIYKPDFIVDDKVILEIKAVEFIPPVFKNQLSYYLKGTDYKVGLLVNFGTRKAQIYRRVYEE